MKRHLMVATAVLASLAGTAFALEFRSVKETGVALYEAPTLSAPKLFVVSRYFPVEVMNTQKDWSRVRDATGGIAWIPSAALSVRRTLLVTADRLAVREAAEDQARLVFWAEKDLVLDMLEAPQSNWVKVKHRDGSTGYARISSGLWGL